MSTRFQRRSGVEMTEIPLLAAASPLRGSICRAVTKGSAAPTAAETHGRAGRLARHLYVKIAVDDFVAGQNFAQDDFQRARLDRRIDAKLRQGTREPAKMTLFVDKGAVKNLAHLIDAIAELIAAILDRHARVAALAISAVDIGNSAQLGHLLCWAGHSERCAEGTARQREQRACRDAI